MEPDFIVLLSNNGDFTSGEARGFVVGGCIAGVWGRSPQWGPGAQPLVREAKPPEAEEFSALRGTWQICHPVKYSINCSNENGCLCRHCRN